jgi:hypothetical protein
MQVVGVARSYDEFVEALRRRKDQLGLSNECVEHIGDLTAGFCDKLIGPSQTKKFGRFSLDAMLGVLGLSVVVVVDDTKVRAVKRRYERRDDRMTRMAQDRRKTA